MQNLCVLQRNSVKLIPKKGYSVKHPSLSCTSPLTFYCNYNWNPTQSNKSNDLVSHNIRLPHPVKNISRASKLVLASAAVRLI